MRNSNVNQENYPRTKSLSAVGKHTEFNLDNEDECKKQLIAQRILPSKTVDSSIEALHIYTDDNTCKSPDAAPYEWGWEK